VVSIDDLGLVARPVDAWHEAIGKSVVVAMIA
jgi:hypothetical protein